MNNDTPETIKIPLSEYGRKYAGLYQATVDTIDADLNTHRWNVTHSRNNCIYAQRWLKTNGKRTSFQMHREVMQRMLGNKPIPDGMQVDHINGDGLDNRRENLRLATHSQNQRNRGKQKNNTSGYKGVHWDKKSKKWRAEIKVNGKYTHLGSFDTPEAGYRAYCEALGKYHGDFANEGQDKQE